MKNIEEQVMAEPWEAPTPLSRTESLPRFDPEKMIPDCLDQYRILAHEVAEAFQVPLEMPIMFCTGLTALAASRSYVLRCNEDWEEPPQLWTVTLLEPGDRKSAVVKWLSEPFNSFEESEAENFRRPLAHLMERRQRLEYEMKSLRRSGRNSSSEERASLEAERERITEALADMPIINGAPILSTQTYTPEGLRDMLHMNGEKAGIVSAETDPEDIFGARYAKTSGPNIDLLLSGHAGDAYSSTRAGGKNISLHAPAISMALAVQSGPMRAVMSNPTAINRGLTARFLILAPRSRMGSRIVDTPSISTRSRDWWRARLQQIVAKLWHGRPCVSGRTGIEIFRGNPVTLTLDSEARRHLNDLREHLEPRMARGRDLSAISGFASKLPGGCVRIATGFAVLDNPEGTVVSGEHMRAACAWSEMLIEHHRGVVSEAAELPETHQARRLLEYVSTRKESTITARDAFYHMRDSAVPNMEAMRPILQMLVNFGWLRSVPHEKRPGRSSEVYAIHPNALAKPDTAPVLSLPSRPEPGPLKPGRVSSYRDWARDRVWKN